MFSVEFTLGRRNKSKPASFPAQIERFSCERSSDAIDGQIDNKQRYGLDAGHG
jgi:hypothetical protein